MLGSKKREGNDDLQNAQSDGLPRRTPERSVYASILERPATLCGEQDAKGYQGGGRRAGYPEADALIEEIMNLYYEKGYVLKQFAVESKPLQLYVAVMEHPDV